MLKIAERSVRADMVAQGGAAGLDRLGDDLMNGRVERDEPRAGCPIAAHERTGRSGWSNACAPERLADIDIAEPAMTRWSSSVALTGWPLPLKRAAR